MTQEETQILLKDLCARVPYGVKVDHFGVIRELLGVIPSSFPEEIVMVGYDSNDYEDSVIEDIKPYLRPMSSMTEEEKKELKEISDEYLDKWMSVNDPSVRCELDAKISSKRAEFYNSHYLDWNGLIEKDIALKAPEDMYKTQ